MKPIQAVVIVFAVLVGYVVFFLGIRPAKWNRINHRNLFLATFFLFFTFLSFGKVSYAQEDKPTVFEQLKDTRFTSAQKIVVLSSTAEWKNFKAFWKKLDQVEPKNAEPDKDGVYHRYSSISPDEWSNLQKELGETRLGLEKLGGEKITAAEINFLENVARARIDYLRNGDFMSMLTRMASPAADVKPRLLHDLELKIDGLLDLKKAKIIDPAEYRQALANIQGDIKKFCVLDVSSEKAREEFKKAYSGMDELIADLEND